MHFYVVLSVFIHPCTKKKAEESSVFTQSWRGYLCARSSYVCARLAGIFSHSARLLLQQSRASFMLALWLQAVFISSPDTWDWTRMHRRTLYENVDSVKIKVTFYTTDIDILLVASMHRIVIHYIDPYRWIITPLRNTVYLLQATKTNH